MMTLIVIAFIFVVGFMAGQRYGHNQATADLKRIIQEVLRISRNRE